MYCWPPSVTHHPCQTTPCMGHSFGVVDSIGAVRLKGRNRGMQYPELGFPVLTADNAGITAERIFIKFRF